MLDPTRVTRADVLVVESTYGNRKHDDIEPELREDAGEIEAARAGRLPMLITQADLSGDCHTHSEWSDGNYSIEDMAEACRRRGYAYAAMRRAEARARAAGAERLGLHVFGGNVGARALYRRLGLEETDVMMAKWL